MNTLHASLRARQQRSLGSSTTVVPAVIAMIIVLPAIYRPSGPSASGLRLDTVPMVATGLVAFIPSWSASQARFLRLALGLALIAVSSLCLNMLFHTGDARTGAAVIWGLFKIPCYYASGLLIADKINGPSIKSQVSVGLAFACAASLLLAILQAARHVGALTLTVQHYNRSTELGQLSDLQLVGRPFGTFDGQPNSLGLYGAICVAWGLTTCRRAASIVSLVVLGASTAVISQSRTAILIVLISLSWSYPGRTTFQKASLFIGGLAASVSVVFFVSGDATAAIIVALCAVATITAIGVDARNRKIALTFTLLAVLILLVPTDSSSLFQIGSRDNSPDTFSTLGGRTSIWSELSSAPLNYLTWGTVGVPTGVSDNGYLSLLLLLGIPGCWIAIRISQHLRKARWLPDLWLFVMLFGMMTTSTFLSGRLSDLTWLIAGLLSSTNRSEAAFA